MKEKQQKACETDETIINIRQRQQSYQEKFEAINSKLNAVQRKLHELERGKKDMVDITLKKERIYKAELIREDEDKRRLQEELEVLMARAERLDQVVNKKDNQMLMLDQKIAELIEIRQKMMMSLNTSLEMDS